MLYEQIIDTPLRAARINKELSQQKVATYLHLKNNTMISRWENGRMYPCLIHALQLAALYEVSVEKLFPFAKKNVCNKMEEHDNSK